MGLEMDADQILLRLTSPTSQFVDHAKEMALGSGDESWSRGGLSISTPVHQPDVPQYVGTLRKPGHLADPHGSCFLKVSWWLRGDDAYSIAPVARGKKAKLATSHKTCGNAHSMKGVLRRPRPSGRRSTVPLFLKDPWQRIKLLHLV